MGKPSPWGSHQGNGWGSGGMSWGRDHRRGSGMGVPGSVSHASPLKKPFSSNVIAPPKFPRSGGSLGPKSWIEENIFRTDSNSNSLLPLQVEQFGVFLQMGGASAWALRNIWASAAFKRFLKKDHLNTKASNQSFPSEGETQAGHFSTDASDAKAYKCVNDHPTGFAFQLH